MEAYPEMLKLANLVLELDSLSGYGYEIKAIIDYYFHYDFARSKKNYEKALALDPENGEFYRAYADWFTWLGRFDEALETDKKVIELDPLYPYNGILHALHLFLAGERDSAFSVMYAIDKHGGYKGPWLGILYLKEGNYQQAIQEMEHTEILSDPFAVSQLGLAYSKTGNLEMTSSLLDLLESRSGIEYVSYIHRGALLAELGRKQEALDYLRLGYEEREEYIIMLMHFDRLSYAGLRTHPEFMEIMQKVMPR